MDVSDGRTHNVFQRMGDECKRGDYNSLTGQCEMSNNKRCQSPTAGNPIEISTGYKIQAEYDLGDFSERISFYRYYSSRDGQWNHNFSDKLTRVGSSIYVIAYDGRTNSFTEKDGLYLPVKDYYGQLRQDDGEWVYTSSSRVEKRFDAQGNFLFIKQGGLVLYVRREGSALTVSDSYGENLVVNLEASGRLRSARFGSLESHYTYSTMGRLIKVSVLTPEVEYNQTYLYEDERDPRLLTAAYKNGVLQHRWTYDNYARAISSQSAISNKKVFISYALDGDVTVLHGSGLEKVYRRASVSDRDVIGSTQDYYPSGCASPGKFYEYGADGLSSTLQDNNGNRTTFLYTPEQFELSRTEAEGTPVERTTYRTWDPTRGLPQSISYSGQAVFFDYNEHGQVVRKRTVGEEVVK